MSAPSPVRLRLAGAPERWHALGFEPEDDGSIRLGALALSFVAGDGGLVGWSLSTAGALAQPADIDGIQTTWEPALPPAPGRCTVDHIVVLTPCRSRTVAALQAVGMRLRRERETERMRQAFFRHGEAVVEVVQPRTKPVEEGGKAPARLWGLTLSVDDLDAIAARLGPVLGPISDAVQPGRRIVTVRREAGLGTALALMSA
ncbi:MAG TPA: VOC family protein [Solirubrobacteraceae bacterium]|jgi:hypothetical protein|nr:VOC family protein [Solirubrobacteraceae bacterium]